MVIGAADKTVTARRSRESAPHPLLPPVEVPEPGAQEYAGSEPATASGMENDRGWLHIHVTTTTTEALTVADRCDRCGAQAYVRVLLPAGELYFCAHHARAHSEAFTPVATHVQDETDRLLAEHGAGAATRG